MINPKERQNLDECQIDITVNKWVGRQCEGVKIKLIIRVSVWVSRLLVNFSSFQTN